jgi:protein-disulfide isomerase
MPAGRKTGWLRRASLTVMLTHHRWGYTRMRRLLLILSLLLPAAPVVAQDSGFTPAQRAEIVAILRHALTTDPNILRDAVESLKADDAKQQQASAHQTLSAERQALLADPRDQTEGNPHGDVSVVVFYDPRCPYCRRMEPVFTQLMQADPHVRLVLKDLPILGPASVLETRALIAAQKQGGYLKLMSALMSSPPDATEALVQQQATRVGLDVTKLQHDMQDPAIDTRLDANLALARRLGIEGTPMMVVGDAVLQGAVELSDLQQAVAAARKG